MNRRRYTQLLILSVLVASLAQGCAGQEPTTPIDPRRAELRDRLMLEMGAAWNAEVPPSSPEKIEQGKQVYRQLCEACHAADGSGTGLRSGDLDVSPADLRHSLLSDAATMKVLREGIDGTPMTPWEGVISESELVAVMHYVRTLQRRAKQ